MLQIFKSFLLAFMVFVIMQLPAGEDTESEIGYECDSLIGDICSEKQVEIFTKWNEMNDEDYDLNVTFAKKIAFDVLNLCEGNTQSEVLCTLVTTEAKIQIISHSIPELNEKILARIIDLDFLLAALEQSIYLGVEYLRLLNLYTWEDELIQQFSDRVLSAALDLKIDEQDPWIVGEIHYAIATFNYEYGNFADAKNFYNKAIIFFEIAGDIESIIWTYYDIANIQLIEEDYESARIKILEALSKSENEDNVDDLKLSLYSLLGTVEINLDSGREDLIGKELLDIYAKAFDADKWNLRYDEGFVNDVEKYIQLINCDEAPKISSLFKNVLELRDKEYSTNQYYLDSKVSLESAYFEIEYKNWSCLVPDNTNEEIFLKKTNNFLKNIEHGLDAEAFYVPYFDSHVFSNDLYDYFWGFDNAVAITSYDTSNFYKKITKISEKWLDDIFIEDPGIHIEAIYDLLSIIAHAIRATNNTNDSEYYVTKLKGYLETLSSLNLLNESPKTFSFNKLFHAATTNLYEFGFPELAENIYRNYFFNISSSSDERFTEIVKRINLFDEQHFIMTSDILIDEDIHQIRSMDNTYEFDLLDQNFKSKMKLNRSKYEVIALKDYFEDSDIKELIQAYVNTNSENIKAKATTSFLENDNLSAYLDLVKQSESIDIDDQKALLNEFFPDIKFLEYQSALQADEALVIQTIVTVDYSIYLYSILVTDDDYYIARENLFERISPYLDDNYEIDLSRPKELLIYVWSKYIDEIKKDFFKSNEFLKIGLDLSDMHLFGAADILRDINKLIFINDITSIFSPDLLIYEDDFLVKRFEVTQYISLFDFLNRKDHSETYDQYFGFAVEEFDSVFNLDPLPNTVSEIENSARNFKVKANYINNEFSKKFLSNRSFKNSVLHFATHNSLVPNEIFGSIPALITGDQNPSEVLDVLSISELDLEESFILLAACNTTDLIYEDNDAFSGIVKSFKIAGAESVFATRWEIETKSSEKFVVSFLEKLSKGENPNAALHQTKLEFIKSREFNHPIFWGAFTLVN